MPGEMDPFDRLLAENRARRNALPWWRRFPWWLIPAVPLTIALWALMLLPVWQLFRFFWPA